MRSRCTNKSKRGVATGNIQRKRMRGRRDFSPTVDPNADAVYGCSTCTMGFHRASLLKGHIQKCHGSVQGYRCAACNVFFATENTLRRHEQESLRHFKILNGILTNNSVRIGKQKTPKTRNTKESREEEKERRDLQEVNEDDDTNQNGNRATYQSEHGDDLFGGMSKEEIRSEKRRLSKRRQELKRPFKCTEPGCKSSFTCKASVQIHIRLCHLGVQCHQCQFCWKGFPSALKLQSHNKTEHADTVNANNWEPVTLSSS